MHTNSALKVLLINPTITMGKLNYASGTPYPSPLGSAYVNAFFERYGFSIQRLNAKSPGIDRIEERNGNIRVGLADHDLKQRYEHI